MQKSKRPEQSLRNIVWATKRYIWGPPRQIVPSDRDDPQEASVLLTRVPVEIRIQIWDHCFYSRADRKVHIVDGTGAFDCIAPDEIGDAASYHATVCERQPPKNMCGALLLLCRRLYFECLPLLYSKTLFDFYCYRNYIRSFANKVPSYNLAHIARVRVAIPLPSWTPKDVNRYGKERPESRKWSNLWKSLAALQGLRWLRVEMVIPHQYPFVEDWIGDLDLVLDPVKMVTRPEHFELLIPFDVGERGVGLPCKLVRSEPRRAGEW
ncbi:hypothetical protein CC79DRAFT_1335192 [Sarocladium strictum]